MGMLLKNIPLRNVSDRQIRVAVEPWANEYLLPPNESLRIVFYGPDDGDPEVVIAECLIAVYGWMGSEAFVLKNNIELEAPTLLEVIQRVIHDYESVDDRALSEVLSVEELEFAQALFDESPAWDDAGRDAAHLAVSRLAPILWSAVRDRAFVWETCQCILRSRGVFWSADQDVINDLFHKLEYEPDVFPDAFSDRLQETSSDKIVMAGWPTRGG